MDCDVNTQYQRLLTEVYKFEFIEPGLVTLCESIPQVGL